MRAPAQAIFAPPFPRGVRWLNTAPLRLDHLRGHPLLIEFWDFCRPNSMRTLPYVKAWHERYGPHGLHVVGAHASGFPPSSDPEAVAAAVERLRIAHPVLVDSELELWRDFGNLGWPARYLFDGQAQLVHYHYGEGAYEETELAIQELLGLEGDTPPLAPLRPEDAPDAVLAPQSEDVPGPYSGPYEAGAVWAVLDGHGTVSANGRTLAVEHPGAYELISHPHSASGTLHLRLDAGVRCHAVCFTPGVAG